MYRKKTGTLDLVGNIIFTPRSTLRPRILLCRCLSSDKQHLPPSLPSLSSNSCTERRVKDSEKAQRKGEEQQQQ